MTTRKLALGVAVWSVASLILWGIAYGLGGAATYVMAYALVLGAVGAIVVAVRRSRTTR